MSEDKFTEADAENDGLVKREAGQQLNSVLARDSGQLYTKFREYCGKIGRDPSVVLGDMILRAIRDENFAQEVSNTVADVEKLNRGEVRKEDLELVTDLIEKFGGNEDKGKDPIDEMLEKRLSAIGQGPFDGLDEAIETEKDSKDKKIEELEREIERLKQQNVGGGGGGATRTRETTTQPSGGGVNDIDELFEDDGTDSDGGDDVDADVSDADVQEEGPDEVDDLFDGDGDDDDDYIGDTDEPEPKEGPDAFNTEAAVKEVGASE